MVDRVKVEGTRVSRSLKVGNSQLFLNPVVYGKIVLELQKT